MSTAHFEAAVAAAERDGEVAGGGRRERPGHCVEPEVVAGLPLGPQSRTIVE